MRRGASSFTTSSDPQLPVHHRDRLYRNPSRFKPITLDRNQRQIRLAAPRLRLHKDVLKRPFEVLQHILASVDRERSRQHIIVATDVVQAKDVVCVGVGEEERVDPGHVGAHDLQTQLRRGVHKQRLARDADGDAAPGAMVAGIG